MAFEPKSGGHAIVEAVFGLRFSQPFSPDLLEKVVSSHDEWRERFPRISRGVGFQFQVGQDAGFAPIPLAQGSVAFDRLKPDGGFEWRLRFEGDRLFVNCLAYSRWNEVWGIVSQHLFRAGWLATEGGNPVAGVLLQYIDIFEWNGPLEEYDVAQLLKKGTAVPETILNKGPFWHLHQGWFRREPRVPRAQLLERLHLDAVEDERRKPFVRMDSYLEAQLQEPIALVNGNDEKNPQLTHLFDVLHDLDKELLDSVLNKKAAKRIKLDV